MKEKLKAITECIKSIVPVPEPEADK